MAIFYLVLGCSLFFSVESPEVILFSYHSFGQEVQAIISCYLSYFILIIRLAQSHLPSQSPSHLSQEMGNACSADFKALGKSGGLSQVHLVLTHLQAIYALCPFHMVCRQILWYWCSEIGSLCIGTLNQLGGSIISPDCILRFGLKQDTRQNCSCSSPLPRGPLPPLK